MPRAGGVPQWQLIEVMAAFRGGEAANDAKQVSTAATRMAIAAQEYADHLNLLNVDPSWVNRGENFQEKTMRGGKNKFTLKDSILHRGPAVLKKHKEILAFCRRVIMPAYYSFFTKLGKAPSGSQVQDAEAHVLQSIWQYMEEDRVKKLQGKNINKPGSAEHVVDLTVEAKNSVTLATQIPPPNTLAEAVPVCASLEMTGDAFIIPVAAMQTCAQLQQPADAAITLECAAASDQELPVVAVTTNINFVQDDKRLSEGTSSKNEEGNDDVEEDEGKTHESKIPVVREMPKDFAGPKEYTVWRMCGPLAPAADISESLTGPGEAEGKPRETSSRSFQRNQLHIRKRGPAPEAQADGDTYLSENLSEVSLARALSPETVGSSSVLQESVLEVKRLRTALEQAHTLEMKKLKLMTLNKNVEQLKLLFDLEDEPQDKLILKAKLKDAILAVQAFQAEVSSDV